MTDELGNNPERHGHGFFDCPMSNCHEAIVGSYGDLLAHLDDEHPLAKSAVDGDGDSVRERVKAAQKDALARDIEEKMMVAATATKQIEAQNNERD